MLPSGFVASQRLAQPKAPNSVARKNIWPTSGDVTPFAGRSPAPPQTLQTCGRPLRWYGLLDWLTTSLR